MLIGIKNNNPWNLKCADHRNPWKGTAGYDAAGHVIFHHVIFAVRAVCRDIAQKYLGGRKTLLEIMARYSPASDTLGSLPGQPHNEPAEAADFIAQRMGVASIRDDVKLFCEDGRPESRDRLCRFLEALYRQECGWSTPPLSRMLLIAGMEEYEEDFVQ